MGMSEPEDPVLLDDVRVVEVSSTQRPNTSAPSTATTTGFSLTAPAPLPSTHPRTESTKNPSPPIPEAEHPAAVVPPAEDEAVTSKADEPATSTATSLGSSTDKIVSEKNTPSGSEPERPTTSKGTDAEKIIGRPAPSTSETPTLVPKGKEPKRATLTTTQQSNTASTSSLPEDEANAIDKEEMPQASQSRKRARSPSPVDPLSMPAPPRPTIRLSFPLHKEGKGKSEYIYNIPKLAVKQLKNKYPEWTSWYSAMYLEQDEAKSTRELGLSVQELKDLGGLAKLLHKYPTQGPATHLSRKRRVDEYDVGSYDTKDPFVDDSELGVDEPTHIVRTQADGFYVAQGKVELARAKMSAIPSSRSASAFRSSIGSSGSRGWAAGRTNKLLAKRAASRRQEGSVEPKSPSPQGAAVPNPTSAPTESVPKATTISSAETPSTLATTSAPSAEAPLTELATMAPAPSQKEGNDKKKNKYPTRPVHPQLQAMFDHLKTLVSQASFAVKTKFPPELKPPLIETAKLAVELDEYNENFFNYLPSIFPYNRFTMMKLTKREFFHKHMAYFKELQEEHFEKLGRLIQESFPAQVAEYEALCLERGVEGKDNTDGGVDDEVNENGAGEDSRLLETDDLVKRFRWSDDMRDELFTIVTVENAMSEIRNEKLYVVISSANATLENWKIHRRRTVKSMHASRCTNVYVPSHFSHS